MYRGQLGVGPKMYESSCAFELKVSYDSGAAAQFGY